MISRVAIGPRSTFARSSVERRLGVGSGDLAHDLGEREIGDALAVRDTASDDDARLLLERAHDLSREAGLPDPGRPDDRGEPARRLSHRGLERAGGARRALGADRRRGWRSGARRRARPAASRAASRRRAAGSSPSPRTAARRLDDDGIPDEAVGRLADEHLARLRSLLEPRRDVDRVAGRELLIRDGVPDDHLARVDAGARRDANPVLAREILVDALESLAHLERRPHGAERVVLVDGRHAEHGHDRVADELLDGAAVSFERCLHRVEVAPHHTPQRLGVEPLAERRRAGDVREDDRDHLPRLGVASPERRAARHTRRRTVRRRRSRPAGTADHDADPTFRTSRDAEHAGAAPDHRQVLTGRAGGVWVVLSSAVPPRGVCWS